ncbi:fungal-specific transcription factor domain-containing protein [Lipomyces doorenjongii]|uniref:fungal-specific transcription factor domain-containing protein n=1 Tax=Lipomyces doorenjongii TaxID=383834 RepID=UPI0034CD1FF0
MEDTTRVSSRNLDDDPIDDGHENTEDGHEATEGPACLACRKRKRRCSRTQPCFQCTKNNLACEYDELKSKPKLKAGVLQSHSERLDNLEKMFLGQCLILRQIFTPVMENLTALASSAVPELVAKLGGDNIDSAGEALLSLSNGKVASLDNAVKELRHDFGLPSRKRHRSFSPGAQSDESDPTIPAMNGRELLEFNSRGHHMTTNQRTRQHSISNMTNGFTDRPTNGTSCLTEMLSTFREVQSYLPPDDLMSSLIGIYFETSHPWIPVLHREKFEGQLRRPDGKQCLDVILHAIVVATVRFSWDARLKDKGVREKLVQACRQYVILKSIESYSVENLQASIIVAFDSIGGGKGPRSWAIVDSMTRTVEHLRLSVEDDDGDAKESASSNVADPLVAQAQKFMTRMTFLKKSESWIESEERRRVFWNVFLLDRFCSISTGWNPSLTAVDVQRRLPTNGELWAENKPAKARYFGLQTFPSPSSLTVDYDSEEVTALGGFSYCVEASEYLSTVTRFFLQQDVTPKSITQLQEWIFGFKDLDLRLAKWKFDLPAQWREAKVKHMRKKDDERKNDALMDENLTLAHITHNTSVILLHQFVAYPIASWQVVFMKSSQRSSAETCIAATKEICHMTRRYLGVMHGIVNPQFAFCLLVCGRMLLSHSSFTKTSLLPEFEFIVDSLGDMARRWHGVYFDDPIDNLASKFQRGLINTRAQMVINEYQKVDIQQPVYSLDSVRDNVATARSSGLYAQQANAQPTTHAIYPELLVTSTSPPLPITFQADRSMLSNIMNLDIAALSESSKSANSAVNFDTGPSELVTGSMNTPENGGSALDQQPGDFGAWFDDPQFLELDRVWTFGNLD